MLIRAAREYAVQQAMVLKKEKEEIFRITSACVTVQRAVRNWRENKKLRLRHLDLEKFNLIKIQWAVVRCVSVYVCMCVCICVCEDIWILRDWI